MAKVPGNLGGSARSKSGPIPSYGAPTKVGGTQRRKSASPLPAPGNSSSREAAPGGRITDNKATRR